MFVGKIAKSDYWLNHFCPSDIRSVRLEQIGCHMDGFS